MLRNPTATTTATATKTEGSRAVHAHLFGGIRPDPDGPENRFGPYFYRGGPERTQVHGTERGREEHVSERSLITVQYICCRGWRGATLSTYGR